MSVNLNIDELNQEIRANIMKQLPTQDRISTKIDGLMLTRFDEQKKDMNCFYYPMFALVIQGFKNSVIGGREINYGPNNFLIVGLDMPGVYNIAPCDSDNPFLSLSLKLDKQLISDLVSNMHSPIKAKSNIETSPVITNMASADLLDAVLRLLRLLEDPSKLSIMGPLVLKEIYFYLLQTNAGEILRLLNTNGAQINQLSKSIKWLRENFKQSFQIDELASLANMAPSTFFRNFKKATSVSPIQFQKTLRLYEAQRIMLKDGIDANTAALNVGYESVSQFNREYKRQFGAPPRQDVFNKLNTLV